MIMTKNNSVKANLLNTMALYGEMLDRTIR